MSALLENDFTIVRTILERSKFDFNLCQFQTNCVCSLRRPFPVILFVAIARSDAIIYRCPNKFQLAHLTCVLSLRSHRMFTESLNFSDALSLFLAQPHRKPEAVPSAYQPIANTSTRQRIDRSVDQNRANYFCRTTSFSLIQLSQYFFL